MKKLLATILLGAISVSSVFAFTACNPDVEAEEKQEEKQTETVENKVTEVTEEEWKEAIEYLTVEMDEQTQMPVVSELPKTNIRCAQVNTNYEDGKETGRGRVTVSFDFENSVLRLDTEYNGTPSSGYDWKEGNVWYRTVSHFSTDEETGKTSVSYTKTVLNGQGDFSTGMLISLYVYAGGNHFLALALADKFGDFTYSEEKEEYTATMNYELGGTERETTITLKFEHDKLAFMSLAYVLGENSTYVSTYEFTYGETVAVPDEILNLEVAA